MTFTEVTCSLESGLCVEDVEQSNCCLWCNDSYIIPNVFQMPFHGWRIDSGGRVDCEDGIARFPGDLRPLVRTVDDARDNACLVADKHILRLQGLCIASHQCITFDPL